MTHSAKIGVVGAGAWGTALAQMLSSDGSDVLLWAREPELLEAINIRRRNSLYLPSASLSRSITATDDLALMAQCEALLLVTPAQHLAATLSNLPQHPRDLVLCAKGIEQGSQRLLHDLAKEIAPTSDIAVLSGPTFAHEVAAGLPTAVTLACGGGREQWQRLAPSIARSSFRPYYSDDLTGAEIGGAVKNVLAIACGVVEGLGFGQNARSALIARGYAEMERFGEAMGARRETLVGLCGMGDLVLTCSSTSSRNFSLGKALGEGGDPVALMSNRHTVAEGAHTAPVLLEIAHAKGIAMPICEAVGKLLNGATAQDIAVDLLTRPLTAEGKPAAKDPNG